MHVEWEPFFLSRDTPAEGVDLIDYMRDRYGADMARNFDKRSEGMEASGRAVGISFNRSRRVVNTLDGHRLMEYVKASYAGSMANALMEELFKEYFERAGDVSKKEVLEKVLFTVFPAADAAAIGAAVLEDKTRGKEEVLQKDAAYKAQNIGGVPYFIIAEAGSGKRPVTFSGAQPVKAMEEIFSEVLSA